MYFLPILEFYILVSLIKSLQFKDDKNISLLISESMLQYFNNNLQFSQKCIYNIGDWTKILIEVGRSFEFSSKTGQRMDWGPPGFTFSTFYCFPNLTPQSVFSSPNTSRVTPYLTIFFWILKNGYGKEEGSNNWTFYCFPNLT